MLRGISSEEDTRVCGASPELISDLRSSLGCMAGDGAASTPTSAQKPLFQRSCRTLVFVTRSKLIVRDQTPK